jgi:L-ascorbate metabolism protein UlaG (beta-lactamase superfamily)
VSIVVTWLGHATVVVDIDGVRIVADPLLRRHNGLLVRRGRRPDPAAWFGADAVLLSHLHHDHAELASLRLLGGVPILTAEPNAHWAIRKGFNAPDMEPDAWTPISGSEVEVRLTPAVHAARPMPHRPNAANGHLVRGPSGIVWLAGDTELFDGMEGLPELADGPIDVALVPVGGWGPRLSPGHLGPNEASVACRLVGASIAIPVHWGTLHPPAVQAWPGGWMDTPGPKFAAALPSESPTCQPVVLGLGESLTLPGSHN